MMPIQNGRSKEVYTTFNKCWQGEDRLRPTDETMPRNGRRNVRMTKTWPQFEAEGGGDLTDPLAVRGRGWRRPTGK